MSELCRLYANRDGVILRALDGGMAPRERSVIEIDGVVFDEPGGLSLEAEPADTAPGLER